MLARSFLQVRRAGPRALLGLGLERVLLAGVLCVRGVWWAALAAWGGRLDRKLSESFGRSRGIAFDFFFVVGRDPRPPREQRFECSRSLWGASGRETHGVAGF